MIDLLCHVNRSIRLANEAFVTQSRNPWPANKCCFTASEQLNTAFISSRISVSLSIVKNDCSWRTRNWTLWSVLFNFYWRISNLTDETLNEMWSDCNCDCTFWNQLQSLRSKRDCATWYLDFSEDYKSVKLSIVWDTVVWAALSVLCNSLEKSVN